MHIRSIGSISPSISSLLSLPYVFYVRHLSLSLISLRQLFDSDFDVIFSLYGCVMQDQESTKQIGIGRRVGDLSVLERLHIPQSSQSNYIVVIFSFRSTFFFFLSFAL